MDTSVNVRLLCLVWVQEDFRRSGIARSLLLADSEDDINNVRHLLSYEHFYVIYCKFWELDSDHDLMLDRDDLLQYGECYNLKYCGEP